MSAIGVICRRTVGFSLSRFSSVLVAAAFLGLSGLLTAFGLRDAEGTSIGLSSVWVIALSPVLPALAALLAADVLSDERHSGRVDLLLTVPVRERAIVFGKFLGVWGQCLALVVLSLLTTLVTVRSVAPGLLDAFRPIDLLPAFFALALQAALWCAAAVAVSAIFRHTAASACVSLFLLVVLPRGVWYAILSWAPQKGSALGELVFDAHALDISQGLVSTGTVLSYAVLVFTALFIASKCVSALRLVGRGARALAATTGVTLVLVLVFAVLAIALVRRLDVTIDIPVGGGETQFSKETRGVLAGARDTVKVTAFLSRKDARFRPLAHYLRAFKREADASGGAGLELMFVDPRWDLSSAERLVRLGVTEESLVFECGRRHVAIPISGDYGERMCASAIQRISHPVRRRMIYWTVGHGEASFSAYGAWGLSDIARDLVRDGYHNAMLDLSAAERIPDDCALVVVAGARDDFSRAETSRLNAYLKQGGRLLALLASAESGGIVSLLPSWGLRPCAPTGGVRVRTLTGSDVIVDDFAAHAVTEPLRASRIILDRPIAFAPSAAAETGGGADRIEFTALAKAGPDAVAAIAERGVGAGADLAIRPTRLVAIGDAGLVLNGQLQARANANRDFFLNCVSYLAGMDMAVAVDAGRDRLISGLDRAGWRLLAVLLAVFAPALVLFAIFIRAVSRRRRS